MSPVVASRRSPLSRLFSFLFINLVWLAPLFLFSAQSAAAATDTFYVQSTNDDFSGNFANLDGTAANCPANNAGGSGSCTLRDAVTAANADANSAIIDLTGAPGIITLADPLPIVYPNATTNTISFHGPGVGALTVSGANAYQVFAIENGSASFDNFTIANGNVVAVSGTFGPNNGCACDPGLGGGIYAYLNVALTLDSMVLNNNYAEDDGGGIVATGPITVTNSTFSNNSVGSTSLAGAIYAIGNPANISTSSFFGNTANVGSAVYVSGFFAGMTANISDSTFANNPTLNSGSGAVLNSAGATLNIHDSTFWNNIAGFGQGGALNNSGTMTVTDTIVGAPGNPTALQLCYTTTTCPATGDGNGNIVGGDSLDLSPLGFYGGPTETMLPLPGSPAICGGKSGTPYAETVSGAALTTDQRGLPLDTTCTAGSTDAGADQTNFKLVVTSNADTGGSTCGGTCTLRQAITAANASGGDITFSTATNGKTLTLTSNLPEITAASVNIIGNGAGEFTIDGASKYQPFFIDAGSTVAISGLTLQHCYNSTNGGGVGYGGAILDYGTLSVSGMDFLNNTAGTVSTSGEGGAILNASNGSPLTITNSWFDHNSVTSTAGGGAVLSGGPTSISGSTFSNNAANGAGTSGGGIYDTAYSLSISTSTFENNTADANAGYGGAVFGGGDLVIANSTFANNVASDGTSILNDGGTFTITNSLLDNAAACDGANPCPTATNAATGNVVGTGTPVVGTVDVNGGAIPTALPVGASICGGNSTLVTGGYTDERGYGVDPTCASGKMDSGAVQSDYTGIAFSASNYAAISGSPIVSPSVIVYVNEIGQSNSNGVGGVPITLDYTGTETAISGTTASSVAGTGATFSTLTITSTATTPQPVSASISGSSVAAANATITFKQGTTTTTTPAAAAVDFNAAAQNVTLTAHLTPTGINEGNVTFTVCSTNTNPCTGTIEGTATQSATVASSNASVTYALPAGLALGTYTIDAEYIDGSSGTYASSKGTATLTVSNGPTATTAIATTNLTQNHAATPFTPVTGSGGTGTLSYGVSPALPTGLTMSTSTGQITGTPTVVHATSTFTVTVTDSATNTATATFSLTVNTAVTATTAVASTTLTQGHAATAFTPVTGGGGTTPLSYGVSPALPAGLTMSTTTGQITGTPTVASAQVTYTVTVTDANGATATATFDLTVNATLGATQTVGAVAFTLNHAVTPVTPVTGANGTTPYTYGVSPALPAGLAYSTSTGQITGTPTATHATSTFTVTVTDANSSTATNTFTLTVNGAVVATTNVATTILTQNHAATPFTPVAGSGGTGTLSYGVSPALPTGLTMSTSTGQITGTPTVTSVATTYTVTVTDADGATGTNTFSLTVNGAVAATQAVPTIVLTINHAATPVTPVTGSGGTTPLTYGVAPALPAGLAMSTTTGQITGTPTVTSAATTYTVTVTDANSATATATFSLTVNGAVTATQSVATTILTQNHAATPFTPVTGSGGTAPLSYGVAPALPAGLTMSTTTGQITGTPTATSAATTYTVTVTDANSATATATFSLTVNAAVTATQSVATTILTQNHAATPFTPVTGGGGTTPLTYGVAPALPAGLTMSTTTGQITGTPTVASAATTYTVTVTDANSATATATFSLTVNAAVAATQSVPTIALTVNHAATPVTPVTGSGGSAPLSYGVAPALPAGLTMSTTTGQITGTPTVTSAATTYTVTVTDANSATATATFSLTVNAAVTATQSVATTILTQNHAATPFTPVTGGGGTTPLSYGVSPALPAGLAMSTTTGQITGTPAVASAAATYTVTVTDANGATATNTFSLTVNGAVTATTAVASTTLTANHAATPFTPVTGAGGTAPLTYGVSPALPAGLSMSTTTGQITGTPTAASATTTYTVTVTDANSATATATFSLTVSGALAATTAIPTTVLTQNHASAAFTPVTGAGGTAPLSYGVAPALPAGLTMSTSTGAITGTPTAVSAATTYTVTVTDANSTTATATFSLTVDTAVTATTAVPTTTLTAGHAAAAFTPVTGAGGRAPLGYSVSPALPGGLTLSTTTGQITGTPASSSAATTYTVTVTDANGATATATFSLTVSGSLSATTAIASTVLTQGHAATAFTPVTGAGGTAPLSYGVSPALPAGLTMSTTTGQITGTPTAASAATTYTVTVTDAASATATATFSLTVNGPLAATTAVPTTTLLANQAATPFTPVTGAGGTAPLSYSVSPALPAGLSMASSTGQITGTPTVTTNATVYTVTVTDANSATATATFTLTVNSASISITWANPAAITYGTSLAGILNATVTYNGAPVAGTFVYTATPSGGSAATVTSSTVLAAGSYTLTASFTPNDTTTYGTPAPKQVPLTVNQAQPTISWTPAASIAYGTTLAGELSATANFGGNAVAGSFAYTATPSGGSASAVTSATVLAQGSYTLGVTFTPTDATDYKTATATAPLTVTGATLTVSANNATKVYGTANPTFSGSITGQQNGDTFTESFSTTATASSNVGTYPIVPTAAGANLSDYTVITNDGTLTVSQAASSVTLAASATTVNPGVSVTLTATVADASSGSTGTPTGTVTFYNGSTMLGTGTLTAGVATYSTSTLAAGSTNTLTAVYSGDTNFTTSSTTQSITITVAGLGFTLSATPSTQTGNSGTTFTYQLALAPTFGTYPGAVSFAATGGPAGAVFTFTPSTVAANAGATTVAMAVATSAGTADLEPTSTGRKLVPVAFALLLLPLAGTRRMRRSGKWLGRFVCLFLLALGGIAATTALTGCGTSNGGTTKVKQGTQYTITVTATSGNVQQTTTVTLTLQQ